jgi:hypothetical protein
MNCSFSVQEKISTGNKNTFFIIFFVLNLYLIDLKSRYVENKALFFIFFEWGITTEAMGLGGLRENFLSPQRQRKCGRKDCQKHISRPKRIGVC